MSTVDTSTWNPDADLNVDIGGIPLNSDASITQTWQAIQMLMAALKGDTADIKLTINQPDGTTIVATNQTLSVVDNGHAHTIANVAGLQTALDGKQPAGSYAAASHTHGSITNDGKLGTASMAVQTDANGAIAVSSVTATELACLSGVTSAIQTQLDAKAADSSVVHSSNAENIDGVKTFKQYIRCDNSAETRGITGTSSASSFLIGASNSVNSGSYVQVYGKDSSSRAGSFVVVASIGSGSTNKKALQGTPSGTLSWDGQTIQTSSDERLKTPLAAVPDAVLDAWEDVNWGQFQFLEAVQEKGDNARLHLGMIAQKVKAVFEARGLDACTYGILCYDEEDDLWMIRYEEALAMETVFQRRRADRLEARIAEIEARLTAMEVTDA